MRTKQLLAVAGLGLLMTACNEPVRSLQPLYTEKDAIFEPQLLGMWVKEGDKADEIWAFAKSGENEYIVMTNCDPKFLNGRLMKLGGELFLDLTPSETDDVFNVPGHLFVRIRVNGDAMQTALLDSAWVKQAADAGTLGLSHTRIDSTVVLTAFPKELQAFVARHAGNDSIFKNHQEYRRAESGR
jgi:hypothetical protein